MLALSLLSTYSQRYIINSFFKKCCFLWRLKSYFVLKLICLHFNILRLSPTIDRFLNCYKFYRRLITMYVMIDRGYIQFTADDKTDLSLLIRDTSRLPFSQYRLNSFSVILHFIHETSEHKLVGCYEPPSHNTQI